MNWGKAIVLSYALFIGFILTMVGMMYQENIDLVAEDYYSQELEYQNQISKQENLKDVAGKIHITRDMEFLSINFPEELQTESLSGKVKFYRPSEANLDFSEDLVLDSNGVMQIPNKLFKSGKWEMRLEFQSDNTPYLFKEIVFI